MKTDQSETDKRRWQEQNNIEINEIREALQ